MCAGYIHLEADVWCATRTAATHQAGHRGRALLQLILLLSLFVAVTVCCCHCLLLLLFVAVAAAVAVACLSASAAGSIRLLFTITLAVRDIVRQSNKQHINNIACLLVCLFACLSFNYLTDARISCTSFFQVRCQGE